MRAAYHAADAGLDRADRGGTLIVAAINIIAFAGPETLPQSSKAEVYARIYEIAIIVSAVSVSGVLLASRQRRRGLGRDVALPETCSPPRLYPIPEISLVVLLSRCR